MAARFGNRDEGVPKSEGVANALNNLLRNLIITCSKSDGVRNYFHVGVIGYGATVAPAWKGRLTGHELVPIRDVAENYARMVETRITEPGFNGAPISRAVTYPVWVEPQAQGSTPMCQALRYAYDILNGWCIRNQVSHPPVVVHITDGEATDGNPAPQMTSLTSLKTNNGPLVLFNVLLSSSKDAKPTSFPDTSEGLADPYSQMLYTEASLLTPHMRQVAWEHGMTLTEESKAFVMNADPSLVVLALEIGTRPGSVY